MRPPVNTGICAVAPIVQLVRKSPKLGAMAGYATGPYAELTLTDGRLDDAHDASDEFARVRASMSRDDLGPRSRERNVVERWIAETFDRTFGASRRRASRTPDEDGR